MFHAVLSSVLIAAALTSGAVAAELGEAAALSPRQKAEIILRIQQIDQLLVARAGSAKRHSKPLAVRSTQFWASFPDPTTASTPTPILVSRPISPASPGRFSTSATDALEAAQMQDTRPGLSRLSVNQLMSERNRLAARLGL